MEPRSAVPMTTAGIFAAILIGLALLSTYVPFFSVLGYFIMPIPVAVIYMRFGLRQAALTGIVAGILLGLFMDPLSAGVQIVVACAIGLALGKGFHDGMSPFTMLAGMTGAVIAVAIITGVLSYIFTGINVFTLIPDTINQALDLMLKEYVDTNAWSAETIAVRQQVDMMKQTIPVLIPIIFCMSMGVIAYLNIRISQAILMRLGLSIRPFLPIRLWEIPRSMVYLYVLAMVMKYWGTTRHLDWLNIVGLNVEQIAYFFIIIEGIAFCLYFLGQRFRMRSSTQALVVVILFFVPMFQMVAFLLGLFDMLLRYRKKREAP